MVFSLLKGIPYYPLIHLDKYNNVIDTKPILSPRELPQRHELIDIKSDPVVVEEMTKYFTEKVMSWLDKSDRSIQISKNKKCPMRT